MTHDVLLADASHRDIFQLVELRLLVSGKRVRDLDWIEEDDRASVINVISDLHDGMTGQRVSVLKRGAMP